MLLANSNQFFVIPQGEVIHLNSKSNFTLSVNGTTYTSTRLSIGPFDLDEPVNLQARDNNVFLKFEKRYDLHPVVKSVGVIGTSLVQQCENFNTSGNLGAASRSWIDWAVAFSKGGFEFVNSRVSTESLGWEPSGTGPRYWSGLNFGVSGQFSTQISARARQVLDYRDNFECIVCDSGTNDMGTQDASHILFHKIMLCEYFAAYGLRVVMLTILAREVSSWSAGGDERKRANFINATLKEYATRLSKSIVLHDWNEEWVDKGSQYGEPRSGFSIDGIHFAPSGAMSVGKGLWDRTLSKFISKGSDFVVSADDTYDATLNPKGMFSTNPRMRGTAGTAGTGVTGDVVDGYTIERITGSAVTAAASKITDADGSVAQRIIFTLTAGSDDHEFYFRQGAPTNISHAFGGQIVRPYAVIRFNNEPDTFYQLGLEVVDQGNTNFRSNNFSGDTGNAPYLIETTDRLVLIGRPLLYTASSTSTRFRFTFGMVDGGSTGASIDVFSMGFKLVDEMEPFVPKSELYISGY